MCQAKIIIILQLFVTMSRKLKYKIISCSSEQTDHPASSLLFAAPQGWHTKRFCSYPQQITVEFYGIAHIEKIQLVSDSRKIASSVQILFYQPITRDENKRFNKYGFMEFNKNENSSVRQQKTLLVDIKCLYLRFLFYKPHKNKENFFSQIGLHQLNIYGSEANGIMPIETIIRDPTQSLNTKLYEQQDAFIYEKLQHLNNQKQKAISLQDYDQANNCKQMMDGIKKLGYNLRHLQQEKKKAIDAENYEKAKQLKDIIQREKNQIEQLINNPNSRVYQPQRFQQETIIEKDNDPNQNEFFTEGENQFIQKHHLDQKYNESKLQQSRQIRKPKLDTSYDDRVIPALLNKNKTQQPQQQQEKQAIDFQIQDIDGKHIKDAGIIQQHFTQEIAKKFFSKHWQYKLQALSVIQQEAKVSGNKGNTNSLLKCFITVIKNSIKQTNFQITNSSLNILEETLKTNKKANAIARSAEINSDLDSILEETIKKLADNNAKIRTLAEKIFSLMIQSNMYGSQVCCNHLMKTKGKISSKLIVSKTSELTKIVTQYGVGQNGAPLSVLNYAKQQLDNPASQVRNAGLQLLAACSSTVPDRVDEIIGNSKQGIQQQYQQKTKQSKGTTKKKKK